MTSPRAHCISGYASYASYCRRSESQLTRLHPQIACLRRLTSHANTKLWCMLGRRFRCIIRCIRLARCAPPARPGAAAVLLTPVSHDRAQQRLDSWEPQVDTHERRPYGHLHEDESCIDDARFASHPASTAALSVCADLLHACGSREALPYGDLKTVVLVWVATSCTTYTCQEPWHGSCSRRQWVGRPLACRQSPGRFYCAGCRHHIQPAAIVTG